MLKAFENWLGLVNSVFTMPARPVEFTKYCLTYFNTHRELWSPLSKTVHSKCSLRWNKGQVHVLNNSEMGKKTCMSGL